MTKEHPTEEQLQEYALQPASSPDWILQHIGSCPACQTSASLYRGLFSALREQPGPSFDFDVAALVLPTVPFQKAKRPAIAYLPVMLLAIVAAIPIYLLKENIANLFSGMSQFFIYACAGSAVILVFVRLVQLIKSYRERFNLLNHFPDLQP